jgi:gamma-glutamylcyclotransferase (GGCT)/AIG2-like uncharacterized protein YtfP
MTLTRVFVYGTLKPGESNYRRYCDLRVLESCPAIAYGQLFALPVGYPAMTEGQSIVRGVVLTFEDSSILSKLDRLEDYHPNRHPDENEYQRLAIEVFNSDRQSLGKAWAYIMASEKVRSYGGILLPEGSWPAS